MNTCLEKWKIIAIFAVANFKKGGRNVNKEMKRIIGAVCLLVLFVAYQTSITAFTHVHYVNGVIITHSHPFHGKHTHSNPNFSLLVVCQLSKLRRLMYMKICTPCEYFWQCWKQNRCRL